MRELDRSKMENLNPKVKEKCDARVVTSEEENDTICDEIDAREVFGSVFFILIECRGSFYSKLQMCGVISRFNS